MIEPTDEMVEAFAAAKAAVKGCPGLDDGDEQGLAAALAIVDRDYRVEPRPRWERPYFCPTSGEHEDPRHGGFTICCERPGLHQRPGDPS